MTGQGVGFGEAISLGFRNYATFSGRASRSAYWYWVLFGVVIGFFASITDVLLHSTIGNTGYGWARVITTLALVMPGLAVLIRRLHDQDRAGWWALLLLIPVVGVIAIVVMCCLRGTTGPNRFGEDPLAVA